MLEGMPRNLRGTRWFVGHELEAGEAEGGTTGTAYPRTTDRKNAHECATTRDASGSTRYIYFGWWRWAYVSPSRISSECDGRSRALSFGRGRAWNERATAIEPGAAGPARLGAPVPLPAGATCRSRRYGLAPAVVARYAQYEVPSRELQLWVRGVDV